MKHLKPFSNNNWKTELYSLLEKRIELGDNLSNKLSKMNDPLADKMVDFLTSDKIKDDANVSKVDYNKEDNKLLTLYDEKGKPRKFKFGKLLSYLGYDTNNIKPYEVENFINQFKRGDIERLKEVKGKDILESYNCKNYLDISTPTDRGGLGVSCMRFDYAQEYLEIYTANPNQVSCLTLYTEEGDKVQGRALIWTLDDGKRFMDRIYAHEKDDYVHFYSYAEEHNIKRDGSVMYVELDRGGEFDYYPYMDTFEYYLPERGLLTNAYPSDNEDFEGDVILILKSTDGTAEDSGEVGEMVYSEYMRERIRKDEAFYSKYMEDWIYAYDALQFYRGKNKKPDWIINSHDDILEVSYISDEFTESIEKYEDEFGDEYDQDEVYALKKDCIIIKQGVIRTEINAVLKDDTDAYVEIDGEYYINSENIYLSNHTRETNSGIYASKDSWDEWQPHNLLVSIWNDERQEMVIISTEDEKYDKIKNEYTEYTSLDNSCNDTEKCYVPTEFITEDSEGIPYIKPDAPLIYTKLYGQGRLLSKKILNEREGIKEIQKGYYSHKNYTDVHGVESNGNIKLYPPLILSYYNGMSYNEEDIPMISYYGNKYKNYEDYKNRMKELYVFFKKFKNENDEDSKFYEEKVAHMEWCLKDYYYFEKALENGTSLEAYLKGKFEQKTDSAFLSFEDDIFEMLDIFIKDNEDSFTANSINGVKEQYGSSDRIFDINKQSNVYISFMGMYYDTPKYKVFPYFYADKIDKYVVYRKHTKNTMSSYLFMSLDEIKSL